VRTGEREVDQSRLRVTGQVDIETVLMRPEADKSSSGVGIAEAIVGLAADLSAGISADLLLLAEDTDIGAREHIAGAEDYRIEVATVTYWQVEAPCYITAGRNFLPFGTFRTHMVSDPLTLELGETNEIAWDLGCSSKSWSISAFGFKGDGDDSGGLAGYGASMGYATAFEHSWLDLRLAYTSDLGYSENLLNQLADAGESRDSMPGWAASAGWGTGPATLIFEYVGAMKRFRPYEMRFAGQGAKPSSWMIEAAYHVALAGRDTSVALGYQGTEESLALMLPRRRTLVALSMQVSHPVAVTLELSRDRDYSVADGGSEEWITTVTVQASLSF